MSNSTVNLGHLSEIVEAIETISNREKIEASDVNIRMLLDEGVTTRRKLDNLGGIGLIKKNFFPNTEKDLKLQRQLKGATAYISKLEREVGAAQVEEDTFISVLSQMKPIKVTPYKIKSKGKFKRMVTLVLSDLHIGSDIRKVETGHLDFGRVEESRRLAKVIQETMDYKIQYRNETELNVLLLGDLIQGNLGHDDRDGAPVAEQVNRCIYLLSQGLGQLVSAYPKITVFCNTGNHGRNIARHPNRAVQQKWDSYETIIAFALKQIFINHKNIKFEIPLTPYAIVPLFNKKMFITHGDTVLKIGYPGTSIKTGSIEAQINKINATLPDSEEYSVFVAGHVHTASITHMSNGAVLITNGALVPSDEFAVSIGLMESTCGQYLFESVEDYPIGDCRLIKLTSKDDNNNELDKIIKPFTGF